jgi:hypothetical protein
MNFSFVLLLFVLSNSPNQATNAVLCQPTNRGSFGHVTLEERLPGLPRGPHAMDSSGGGGGNDGGGTGGCSGTCGCANGKCPNGQACSNSNPCKP